MTETTTKPAATDSASQQEPPLNDRQRAFKRYKDGVKTGGKPFFPYGVYHDVIAAAGVMALIILISVVWFAQANCDAWFNVNCKHAATSMEQHQYTPKTPGATVWEVKNGAKTERVIIKQGEKIPAGAKPVTDTDKPLLGPLYEEQADPATTLYHPRPEWYFYFLFYLLILFAHPDLVVLGTIGLPTIWLILLILWPFLDRKRERRPSRRPIAMTAMVVVAVTLLSFTYLGSQSGKEGKDDFTADQKAMPGYALIFKDARGNACKGCHMIGSSRSGNVGPALDKVGTKNYGLDYQIQHLVDPKSKMPGSQMPSQRSSFNDEELAQLAAFLETLGVPNRAADPVYANAGAADTKKALGTGENAGEKESAGDTETAAK